MTFDDLFYSAISSFVPLLNTPTTYTTLHTNKNIDAENQSVSGATAICLTQCTTSPSQRVDQVFLCVYISV